MAKREISSTLRNLKFMQRAVQREETVKKEENEVVQADEQFPSANGRKKCMVIMEGDPHPGATRGRMSFLSFNPSIDKLNDEASNSHQTEASGVKSETELDRANGSPQDGHEDPEMEDSAFTWNEDVKRKHLEEDAEVPQPNKSQKNHQDSSPQNNRSSQKKHKKEKLDWNVLRPSKSQSKKK